MNMKSLLALFGAWMTIALCAPQATFADHIQTELHSLYKEGAYFDCLKKAHSFAKEDQKSPIPHFYAALAVCHYKEDPNIKARIKNPMSRAMTYLEEAKRRDKSGVKLAPVQKGIAWMQRKMFNGARAAWEKGNHRVKPFFDRMHKLFPTRKGTWRNLYHAGRDNSYAGFDFPEWDHPFFRLADTGHKNRELDRETRCLLLLHNLCRIDPPRFERTYLKAYLKNYEYDDSEAVYVNSLKKTLKEMAPVGFLKPGESLRRAAMAHGKDLSQSGTFEHHGSNGESFSKRMDRFNVSRGSCAENMHAGYEDPLDCFFSLLIDHPIESLGHRNTILSPSYQYMGVGISQKKGDWKIWVFDFSSEK